MSSIVEWKNGLVRDIAVLEEIALRLDGHELVYARSEARCLATNVWMLAWKWSRYLVGWDGETVLEHPADGWTLMAETKSAVAYYQRQQKEG